MLSSPLIFVRNESIHSPRSLRDLHKMTFKFWAIATDIVTSTVMTTTLSAEQTTAALSIFSWLRPHKVPENKNYAERAPKLFIDFPRYSPYVCVLFLSHSGLINQIKSVRQSKLAKIWWRWQTIEASKQTHQYIDPHLVFHVQWHHHCKQIRNYNHKKGLSQQTQRHTATHTHAALYGHSGID